MSTTTNNTFTKLNLKTSDLKGDSFNQGNQQKIKKQKKQKIPNQNNKQTSSTISTKSG